MGRQLHDEAGRRQGFRISVFAKTSKGPSSRAHDTTRDMAPSPRSKTRQTEPSDGVCEKEALHELCIAAGDEAWGDGLCV